nr:MFS transporter [Aldersonia kunmingensis]
MGAALIPVIVLCFGGMVAAITQTMVIPIQPELPKLLDVSAGNASWVITVTLLTGAVAMPIAGRLGDMYGKQRIIALCAGMLVLGSLVCALADGLLVMIIGRGLQGFAMGFIPVGISLMREITPPKFTATAVAAMSATMGVGGAIGLPVSAWVAQNFDWHNLFWFAAALGVIVVVAVLTLVPHLRDEFGGRFDYVGVIGLAIGLVCALVGVSKGNQWGWTSLSTLGAITGGIAVLLLWGWFELRQTDPIIDLRTTAKPAVLFTNFAAITVGFGMMAQSIVLPQLLELPLGTGYGLGQTLVGAGMWMAPGGLMMLLLAPVSSGMIARFGPKYTLAVGAGVIGIGYVFSVFLMNAPWQILISALIGTAGVGIGYAAMPTLIMGNVPMSEAGAAVGLNSLMRSVGMTSASAVMITVLTGSTTVYDGHDIPTKSAFQICFAVGAVAAFVTVVIALLIPVAKARAEARTEDSDVRETANASA